MARNNLRVTKRDTKISEKSGQAGISETSDVYQMPRDLPTLSATHYNVYSVMKNGAVRVWLNRQASITINGMDVDHWIAAHLDPPVPYDAWMQIPEGARTVVMSKFALPKDMKPETLEFEKLSQESFLEYGGEYESDPALVHVGSDRTPVRDFASIAAMVAAVSQKAHEPTSLNVKVSRILDSFGFLRATPITIKDPKDANASVITGWRLSHESDKVKLGNLIAAERAERAKSIIGKPSDVKPAEPEKVPVGK